MTLLLKIISLLLKLRRVLFGAGHAIGEGQYTRGSLSGTLRGIPGGGERGPRVTRGHVGRKSTHGAWVWHAAWTPRG